MVQGPVRLLTFNFILSHAHLPGSRTHQLLFGLRTSVHVGHSAWSVLLPVRRMVSTVKDKNMSK